MIICQITTNLSQILIFNNWYIVLKISKYEN